MQDFENHDADDASEDSQLKHDTSDPIEDLQLKHDACDASENSQLKHDSGDDLEDLNPTHNGDDVPEDLLPKPDANVADSENLQIQESNNDFLIDEEKRWPGWPGETVFRMLIPVQKVGSIIGRKGESVKKITEETKARIKILDAPHGTLERAVMISAKEDPDVPISPAMDGLLRVHKQITGVDVGSPDATSGLGSTVTARILVADAQAGSLIGKQGSSIKSIQDASGCVIRVLGAEHLPVFALQDDSLVEIQGEPAGVHKALELVASHLRKFLVDRSVLGVFETQMQMPNVRSNQSVPPQKSWFSIPQSSENNVGGVPGFVDNPQYLQPPHHYDNYYPTTDISSFNRQPRQASSALGRDSSIGHLLDAQPQQLVATKVTRCMQIPLSYADAVIGISGTNISYARRASGASITVQETRGVPCEMTVEINGSASQIQTAQQLIQNFVADASRAMQNASSGTLITETYNAYPAYSTSGSLNQGYTPYPAEDPVYSLQPSEVTAHVGHAAAADYGSAYGNSYGH